MLNKIKWTFLLVFVSVGMLASFTANAATLYGVSLNGFKDDTPGPSSLYKIDPATGAATLIGTDLGYPVNSIAIDPTTGIMYGSTANWSDFNYFGRLLRINPATGKATVIGPTGLLYCCRVITFDSAGNLWGWEENGDNAVTINKSTGAATVVGDSGISTAGQVMAFDAADNLIMIRSDRVYVIDQATGAAVLDDTLSFDPGSGGADFDPSTGLLWASNTSGRTEDSVIRVSDIAGDSFTDIDTDMSYLIAVTIGDPIGGIGGGSTRPIPSTSIWGLGVLIALIGIWGFRMRERFI
jgi:sugar lactone lactonase YvrE